MTSEAEIHNEILPWRSSLPKKPEQHAREQIDAALAGAGWLVQDAVDANLGAGRGVAVREFPLASGHGYADYALFSVFQWARVMSAQRVVDPQSPLGAWRERILDLHGGFAREVPTA